MYLSGSFGKYPSHLSGALLDIPSGAAGVRVTLRLMRDLVRQYRTDVNLRHTAASLVQHLPQKDWAGQVRTLHEFVRDGIRYIRDVNGVETVQTPDVTLRVKYGDCDDKATLLATMLESIGHPARFVAVGFKEPERYSHVFVETPIGEKWRTLETTVDVPAGWTPRGIKARMIQKV